VVSVSDPVLLLHGQPGSARDWDAVRAAVGNRAHCLAIDRPGWDGETRPLDLAGNARAAVAALDAAGGKQATVVGHSLGAAVAAWVAAAYPDRVRALVLAAPAANCASLNRLDEILATPVLGSALSTSMFAGLGLALRLRTVRRELRTRFGLPDAYLRGYARVLLDPRTWHSFAVEQRMLVRDLPGLEDRLGAISAPTTVVAGTADRIVSPSSVRRLVTQIPGARLTELRGASHLLLQERPEELADLIVQAGRGASEIVESRSPEAAQDSLGSG
jgi:pimeloyl-ACP methyl ester carboxylesterase